MSKVITFDYRKDENLYPIETPIQIEGDLIETFNMRYEFDENDRVIARKRAKWFRKVPQEWTGPDKRFKNLNYDNEYDEYLEYLVWKIHNEPNFQPRKIRYKFDVEISGRHKKDGKFHPAGKVCGKPLNKFTVKLYKHQVKDEYRVKRASCTCQNCPICFRRHAGIRGQSVASRLWAIAGKMGFHLRHWTINYHHKGLQEIDPPSSFEEIKKKESEIREYLEKYHDKSYGTLGYTLTIHPYVLKKDCAECGETVSGGHKTPVHKKMENGEKCGSRRFYNQRWVLQWHWHLITNFHTETPLHLKILGMEAEDDGYQFQNLSRGKKYKYGRITDEPMLARIVSYEFSHAIYIPFKARDIIRFLGSFHHTYYEFETVEQDVPTVDKDGIGYIRVEVKKVQDEGMVARIETNDVVVNDNEGKPCFLMEKIKIYKSVRCKSKEEIREQFTVIGENKKPQRLKPILVDSLKNNIEIKKYEMSDHLYVLEQLIEDLVYSS